MDEQTYKELENQIMNAYYEYVENRNGDTDDFYFDKFRMFCSSTEVIIYSRYNIKENCNTFTEMTRKMDIYDKRILNLIKILSESVFNEKHNLYYPEFEKRFYEVKEYGHFEKKQNN